MGFYYADRPPEKPSRGRFIPGWLKRFWNDTLEVLVIIQVAYSLILPIIGVLFGFVLICFLLFVVGNKCSGNS